VVVAIKAPKLHITDDSVTGVDWATANFSAADCRVTMGLVGGGRCAAADLDGWPTCP
jgi:hypothetical protein